MTRFLPTDNEAGDGPRVDCKIWCQFLEFQAEFI